MRAHTRTQPPVLKGSRDVSETEYQAYCWSPDYKGTQLMGLRLVEHHGKVFKEAVPDWHNLLQKFPRGQEEQVWAWALDRARNIRSRENVRRDREGNVLWGLEETDAHYKFDKNGDIYNARFKMKMETTSEHPKDKELGTAASDDDNQVNNEDLPELISPSSGSDSNDDEQPGDMMDELHDAVERVGENPQAEAEHQNKIQRLEAKHHWESRSSGSGGRRDECCKRRWAFRRRSRMTS